VALNPQPLPPRQALDAAMPRELDLGGELDMVGLQDLLSAMQRALSLAATVSEAHDQATKSIIDNIK
jgi:hypothetical protein